MKPIRMKILSLVLLATATAPMFGQDKVFVSFDPGMNLYNSENSLKTIGNKSLRWSPGFSVAYERDSLWGFGARLEYSFSRSIATEVMQFTVTSPTAPLAVGYFWDDLSFTTHNIDLSLCWKPVDWAVVAGGPTVSLAHRTIEMNVPPMGGNPNGRYFEDRLVSYCLGANGSIAVEVPVSSGSPGAFALLNIKARYLHSILFDARGRNLANYHQSSLMGQVGIGFGVAF